MPSASGPAAPSAAAVAVRSAGGGFLRVRRMLWDRLVVGACYAAVALVILPLGLIIWHLLAKGLSGLTIKFFTHMPAPVGEAGGGMANAIVGTLIVVGMGAVIAVPFGIAAGVYLAEFGGNRFAGMVRYMTDLLSGVAVIAALALSSPIGAYVLARIDRSR